MKRSRILLWVSPLMAAGAIAGCGGSDGSTSTGPTMTHTPTTPVGTVTHTPTTPVGTTTAPQVTTLTIAYRNGEIVGDREPSVPRGTAVQIRVTSDVADEAHLHGYDIAKPISAGQTVTFAFTANLPGKYGLEFHHHSVRLLTLTVT